MSKFIFTVSFLFFITTIQSQNTYYFSSTSGNDSNLGNQESSPFKTILKLNSLTLVAGDIVLFKRGDIFNGGIIVNNSGSENSPIVFNSYGEGQLPILRGSTGADGIPDPLATIRIQGKEYLEFHNLQIENERFDSESGSDDDKSFGIYFRSFLTLPSSGNFEDRNLFKYFRFSNLVFKNIYSISSTNTTFNDIRTTGIYFWDAFVNDVIIENCHFTAIERTGVWLRRYVSDAIIRNNTFVDIGGSGTIISASKRVLYENNLMRFTGSNSDSRMSARGSGMWVFGSDDVVAQFNTSQHARGNGDSSGMHVDYGNTNILFQYNYLEDSAGGFCETLGQNINIIWRYNISVNEGTDDKGGKNILFWVNDYAFNPKKSEQVFIYNNSVYQGRDYQNTLGNSRIELEAKDIHFFNNIIYLESAAKLGLKSYYFDVDAPNFKKNIMFGGNIINSFKNLDATRREVNPRFTAAGTKHFSGYKLLSFSPAKGEAFTFTEPIFPLAGQGIFKDITSKATKDIFGNPVNLLASTNIGAYNGEGESTAPNVTSFEAEDAVIDGGGVEVICENASGGKAVNISLSGNSLTFNNINISEKNTYLIKVYYLNPNLSNLKVAINGGEIETIVLPYSDGFCFQSGNPTSFHFIKELNSGVNTISFQQSIIDKVEVVSVDKASLNLDTDFPINRTEAYLEKTIVSESDNVQLILKNKEISFNSSLELSVFDITGKLLFRKKFTDNNIKFKVNNFGKGLKIVTAKIGQELIVKKLIVK
jgi:hypothetical protein